MTDYPYTFYVTGFEDIESATKWCFEKIGHCGSTSDKDAWRVFDIHADSKPIYLHTRRFDFVDSKTAFEFALTWV